MGREFFCRHLFWGSGGWSRNGSRWLWGHGFSLLLGTILAEVSPLSALEAQTFLHEFGPFLVCHGFVNLGNDVNIHCVFVLLFPEVPSRFSLLSLWSVSLDDSLDLVVIIVNFRCLFIPLRQCLRHIVSVQNLQKGNSDRLLEIVQSSGGVFGYSRIGEEDFKFGNVVFDGRICLVSFG